MEIEHASFGKDAWGRKLFADFFHKCGEFFLVAVKLGKICGYMITCIGGRSALASAELVSLAVDPAYRAQGIAAALIASTLRRLRRRGVERLWLTVKVTNRAAIRLYDRYGFRKSRLVKQYYEDGSDGWRMEKRL